MTGTAISSTTHNNTLSDIASEITNSLDRNGKGAMLAPLELPDGAVGAPAVTFDNDTDCGMYRIGADDVRMAAGGTYVQEWVPTGTVLPLAVTAQKGVVVTQSTTNGVAVTATGNGSGAGVLGQNAGSGPGGQFSTASGTGVGLQVQGNSTGAPLRFVGLAAAPSAPSDGDVYYDTTTGKLRVRAAGAWVDLH